MKPLSIFLSFGLTMLAAGCSDSPAPADTSASAASSDSASVSEQVPTAAPAIDGHELERAIQDPIERARAVEGEIMKATDEVDKELQDQGG